MTSDSYEDETPHHVFQSFAITRTQLIAGVASAVVVAILFDIGVYRGYGATGFAFFLAGSLIPYMLGSFGKQAHPAAWLIVLLMLLLNVRMVWLGTSFQCFLGLVLLATFGMTRQGLTPSLSGIAIYAAQSTVAGFYSLIVGIQQSPRMSRKLTPLMFLTVGLPVGAVLVFGGIFIAANPDLATLTGEWVTSINHWLADLVIDINPGELVILGIVFWIALGQIIPVLTKAVLARLDVFEWVAEEETSPAAALLFVPFRNTLLAVIGLFVLYLVFEFRTLWFREFPKGFYYAGYAHKGAAWLTFALALATATLSLIFRGAILNDPRLPQLKRLAWLWSAANLVLGLAVYNRMWIYIDFNGMTRMRVVGLDGISTVIAGFLLVVWKIRYQKSFLWLIHRQLWALSLAVYILTITPVDFLIHSYNTRQILSGNLAPSVQITEHPVNLGGWLALVPLLDCENKIIREGIEARLVAIERDQGFLKPDEMSPWGSHAPHWTLYQHSRTQLLNALHKYRERMQAIDRQDETDAWIRFREYAYQWY